MQSNLDSKLIDPKKDFDAQKFVQRVLAMPKKEANSPTKSPNTVADHNFGESPLVTERRRGQNKEEAKAKAIDPITEENKTVEIKPQSTVKMDGSPAGFVEFDEKGQPRGSSTQIDTDLSKRVEHIVKQPEQPGQPEASTGGLIGEWETLVENAINQPKADTKLLSDIHQALNRLTAPQDKPSVTDAIVEPIFNDKKHIDLLNSSLPDKNSPKVSRFSENDISLLQDLNKKVFAKYSQEGELKTTVKVPIVDESPPSEAIQGIVAEDARDNAEEPKLPTNSDERVNKITIDTVEPKSISSKENIEKSMPVTPKTEPELTEAKNATDPFDREVEKQRAEDLARSGLSAVEVADTVKTADTVEHIKQPKRGGLLDSIRQIGQIRRMRPDKLSSTDLTDVRPGGGEEITEEEQMAEAA